MKNFLCTVGGIAIVYFLIKLLGWWVLIIPIIIVILAIIFLVLVFGSMFSK
jgi:hypothetical protein